MYRTNRIIREEFVFPTSEPGAKRLTTQNHLWGNDPHANWRTRPGQELEVMGDKP